MNEHTGNERKEGLPTQIITMKDIMEAEFGPGYMEVSCPYLDCGSVAHAEPDAQITCCLDCGRQFNVDNPI